MLFGYKTFSFIINETAVERKPSGCDYWSIVAYFNDAWEYLVLQQTFPLGSVIKIMPD